MHFKRLWILIAALALGVAAEASPSSEPSRGPSRSAPDGPPMRVALVRGAYPGCEPACEEWISAEGKIDKQTPARFRAVLDAVRPRKPPILIHSGGGEVDSAMAIGRLLRQRGFDVAVARTEFSAEPQEAAAAEPAEPKTGGKKKKKNGETKKAEPPEARGIALSRHASCASACTLILAGGTRRFVGPAALVGLHEIVVPEQTVTQTMRYYRIRTLTKGGRVVSKEKIFVGEKFIPRHIARSKPTPETYRRVRRYLVEMGQTKEVVDLMMTAPPESIHWMTRAELASTRLKTDDRGGDALVAYVPPPPPAPTLAAADGETAAVREALQPRFATYEQPSWFMFNRDWVVLSGVAAAAILWGIMSSLARLLRGPATPRRERPVRDGP